MASVTSVELNFLVFRYLHESGFTHSAYTFGNEASINKCPIDGNLVPPGALVTFVQKGLQYFEMEANLSNCDADLEEDFSFLQPLDLITKDVHELRQMISERRKKLQRERNKEFEKEHEGERGRAREKERHQREKELEKDRERVKNAKEREQQHTNQPDRAVVRDHEKVTAKHEENGAVGGAEPMNISTASTSQPFEIPSSDVTILEGHTSEVCACAWSPSGSLLASGRRKINLLILLPSLFVVYVADLCEKVQVATRKSMQLVAREQYRGFRAMKWITVSVC